MPLFKKDVNLDLSVGISLMNSMNPIYVFVSDNYIYSYTKIKIELITMLLFISRLNVTTEAESRMIKIDVSFVVFLKIITTKAKSKILNINLP